MRTVVEISKDLGASQQDKIDEYYLFLSKLCLENGDFRDAYKNFVLTYKLREDLPNNDPKKVEI